jgi:hypothetical protein
MGTLVAFAKIAPQNHCFTTLAPLMTEDTINPKRLSMRSPVITYRQPTYGYIIDLDVIDH